MLNLKTVFDLADVPLTVTDIDNCEVTEAQLMDVRLNNINDTL